jgi:low affinity Fe/Cu permease
MKQKHSSWFGAFSRWTAHVAGSPFAFAASVLIILIWAAMGPLFAFSDTWQLVINTGTTIITFLMVFLIQSTQNRDSAAVQIKLAELLRAIGSAHTSMANLEELDETELEALHKRYAHLADQARTRVEKRRKRKS